MKKTVLLFGAMATIATCISNPLQAANKKHSLVVYYSQSGTTEKVANIIQKKTGADIERLELVNPYSGGMGEIAGAFMSERQSGKFRDLKPMKAKVADYDTLYVGYPVWAGTCAAPIHSFVKTNNLKGKVVIPFCTFGSGGNTSVTDLKAALPESTVTSSWYGVRAARVDKAESEVETFLVNLGVLKGEKKKFPAFSAQRAVTAEEKAIYDKACGDYPMPLGTPESVATRSLGNATEYLFTNSSKDMQGKESKQLIYVTKGNAEGSVPEFTQVER
jgi:flavodoxin